MQVSNSVHVVRSDFRIPVSPGLMMERSVNSFIVIGEDIAVVDTGVAGSESTIFDHIVHLGRRPEDIAHIVLTHAHPDHIGSARAIKQAGNGKVSLHESERHWLEDVERQYAERPVPGFHAMVQGSLTVDNALRGDERLELGKGQHLRAVHAPGHSPGSVCYLLEEEGVLFSGDAVPVRGDLPVYDDAALSIRSLGLLKEIDPVVLLSAWDEPRFEEEAKRAIEDGMDYLLDLDRAVKELCLTEPCIADEALCRRVLDRMGMKDLPAIPLVVRSIASHRPAAPSPRV